MNSNKRRIPKLKSRPRATPVTQNGTVLGDTKSGKTSLAEQDQAAADEGVNVASEAAR